MFWELYSRTYYLHGLPPGRREKWSCLKNCTEFSGFHIKDKYSIYRSCRSRLQAGLKFRPDRMACLGVMGKRPSLTKEQWEWIVTSYLCLVSLPSIWEGRAAAELISKEKRTSAVLNRYLTLVWGISEMGQGSLPLQLGMVLLTLAPCSCLCLKSCTLHPQSVFWSVSPLPFMAAEGQLTTVQCDMHLQNDRMTKGALNN